MESGYEKFTYSIISYMTDKLKSEVINIGIVLINTTTSNLVYELLPSHNIKLKSLFNNNVEKEIYQSNLSFLKFVLDEQIKKLYSHTSGTISSSKFILSLTNGDIPIPNNFIISTPRIARGSSEKLLLNKLLNIYIGSRFIKTQTHTNQIKRTAITALKQTNLLETKVKKNVRIQPVTNLPVNCEIDFVYREENQLQLIQSTPTKDDMLSAWYQKVAFLSSKFIKENNIFLLTDQTYNSDKLNEIIYYLKYTNRRILTVSMQPNHDDHYSFDNLLTDIGNHASGIDSLNELIEQIA